MEFEARLDEALYGASESKLLACLKALPREVGWSLLLGHDPGLGTRRWHCLRGSRAACLREKYPTGALATINLRGEPLERDQTRQRRLVAYIQPRDLE